MGSHRSLARPTKGYRTSHSFEPEHHMVLWWKFLEIWLWRYIYWSDEIIIYISIIWCKNILHGSGNKDIHLQDLWFFNERICTSCSCFHPNKIIWSRFRCLRRLTCLQKTWINHFKFMFISCKIYKISLSLVVFYFIYLIYIHVLCLRQEQETFV